MQDNEPGTTTSVLLLIYGDSVDPEEVTALLTVQPSQSWKKGEKKSYVRRDGTRLVFDSVHTQGGWKLWPNPKSNTSVNDQVQYWAAIVPAWSSFLRRWKEEGATVELNCCVVASETTTIDIPSDTQRTFAEAGLDITIAIYPRRADN